MSRNALQTNTREYEQRRTRSILSRGWDSTSCVGPFLTSTLYFRSRLDGSVIQKHLKRQIISLDGGFQVIADLNAYHTFISSLKVPQITDDFAHLKMLGHVFIVSDAKDLAQIVRDVTRYGGSFRPEVNDTLTI